MVKQLENEHNTTSPPLLVAAHCSTIRRKANRIDEQELTAMLNDLFRELYFNSINPTIYLKSLYEVLHALNSTSISSLISLHSHTFFLLIRNTIQTLLQKLYTTYQLNDQEISVLRNCILLLENLVEDIDDVSKILPWITDKAFIDASAICLYQINKILNMNNSHRVIKLVVHLINMFARIQECLSWDLHQSLFVRLLQPTIDCLTSTTYVQLFKDLKPDSTSLTELQKLFLIKCPYFLETYNGPHMEKSIEQVLKTMLPRYVSILDKNIKQIKKWHGPMMRSIRHLLTTLIFAEGYFTVYLSNGSLGSLINHLLYLISEPTLIKKLHNTPENQETLLIDAALRVFSVLIYEPDALDYIKICKSARIFRALTSISSESIVLNAYMMLASTIDKNDIKELNIDLSQLTFNILNLLYNAVESQNKTNLNDQVNTGNINRNIIQLAQILKSLIQYEQVKNEILKQNALRFLIQCSQKFTGLTKEFFLECLWKLSSNEQVVQEMSQNSKFILSLKDIPKPIISDTQENNSLLHSHSFNRRRRNNTVISSDDIANNEIYKMANRLLQNLVNESKFQENEQKSNGELKHINDGKISKYHIMISYCYDDKDMAYKIQEFLANEGYNIWFKRDNPHEQTTDIQTEVIDNSTLIVLCISNSYKRDNQCQNVAEYAFNSKRPILPLIVRAGYTNDGWLTTIINKHRPIDFATSDFKMASSLLIQDINQHVKKKVSYVEATAITPTNVEQMIHSSTPVHSNRQQQKSFENGISRSITPAHNVVTVEKSSKSPINSNSRPITPGTAPITSVSSFVNINGKINFPEEFLKRDTRNSTYHSSSINHWKRKEILDFLYDSNLNLMMPICESMTGCALIRFFRMCQEKPSRLYSQINHELRCRFQDVTLPMGIYTRFLTEIDNLLTSVSVPSTVLSHTSRSSLKPIQQQLYMPNRARSQPSPMQPSSISSTRSSVTPNRMQNFTPIGTLLESTIPHTTRATGRTIFRPPSTCGQPYNFIVESAEDSTKLLQEFERYGHQLLLLHDKACEHF
ncbi:unnamed protein product [Rotaria sordida]|uniref:TIR domain-containing protein n=1 Tax=Rotaria sordida TaxID=392033 RepID=A0A814A8T8_9BILA|nr:unnamed protein product [Rotaria sordida]CAF0924912.1 unnamed protein product [Rotaria sordida]